MTSEIALLRKENDDLKRRVSMLSEHINLLLAHRYGRSSEHSLALMPGQLQLFDVQFPPPTPEPSPAKEEVVEVAAHKRSKEGRKPLSEELPSVEEVLDIPEGDKTCTCGSLKSCIGEERTSKRRLRSCTVPSLDPGAPQICLPRL